MQVMMKIMIKDRIIAILNAFERDDAKQETERGKIYIYRDGPNKTKQVTLDRGYVESGSLWNVFEQYKKNGGANANKLLSYKNQKGKQTLPNDKEFLKLIIDSAKNDKDFQDAEDKVFDELYWNKGVEYFSRGGFQENLSLAVIQDSILHSGGMLKFLTNKFPEKRPIDGGDEKKWIKAYLIARLNWLSNAGDLLDNTIYRPQFFLREIKRGNWNFELPLVANGTKITV